MRNVILIAAALAFTLPAAAQPAPKPAAVKPAPAPAASLSVRMDALAKFYADNGQFMGTVLVAQGDRILLNKGYGFANLEWKIANTPDTKFRLGSITKQFTAVAVLLLEERGKLGIADPIRKYLPDLPASWDKVTIRHLLSHTGGIPNYTAVASFMKNRSLPVTPMELVAVVKDKPLEFEPGEGWNYSNTGYVVLGALIEKVSGQTYEKFLTENIFTPLGMKDSGYDSHLAVMARRASGYAPSGNGPRNSDYIDMSTPYAAGALYSTTGDLLRWERALFGGKLLSPASLTQMTTMVRSDYALGVTIRTVSGHKLVSHGGGIDGFNTQLGYFPDDRLTVITLGNLNGPGPDTLATKLGAMALGDRTVLVPSERKRVAVNAATLARYTGHYQLNPATVAQVTADRGRVFVQMGNQPKVELYAISQTRFFRAMPDGELEFAGDAGAPAVELVMHPANGSGAPNRAKRVTEAEVKRAAEALAARQKSGTRDPRSEAALRKNIADVIAGTPDYDNLAPGLANATRQQLPQLQKVLGGMGALKAVTFTEVGPGGLDVYKVEFEKGATTWRILLQDDGKVASLGFQPG